jgi:uncharacterized membrane protein
LIAGASGLVLAIALFLPWYENGPATVSAWEVFTVVDVLLALSAVLGIGLLVLTAAQRSVSVTIAADALLTIVATLIALVALIRVLNLPGDVEGASGAGRAAFAWIGLLAAIGVAGGALVAMRDERLSEPGRPTDGTGVPLAAPAEIEQLPAPPASS